MANPPNKRPPGKRKAFFAGRHVPPHIDRCALADDPKGVLFHTIGRGADKFTKTPLPAVTVTLY